MPEELKERSQMDRAFMWDLTGLFADDSAWEQAFAGLDQEIGKLSSYQGTLKDPAHILDYLRFVQTLGGKLENLLIYANCRHDEDTRDAKAQSMYSRIYGKYVLFQTMNAFAVPEMLSLSEKELSAIADDDALKDYRFLLKDLIRQKPHTLSASEEKILSQLGEALSASGQAANTLMDADLTFESVRDAEGNDTPVTGSNYILLQNSRDRVLRENAFRSFYKSYKGHIHTFSQTYNGTVKASVAEAQIRHYHSDREMSMAADNIPESVYDNLIEAVHGGMDQMYRYVTLRKKILGVDELHYYDLYAPLSQGVTASYTYQQAQQMVLSALAPLGTDYTDTVRSAFQSRWIDVYPNKGKRGGAYSSGSYDSTPMILANYTGTLDSVSTIAHEMGHSMHTFLTKQHQPRQYADYSLFVAEVASTVNENLLVEDLLRKEQDPGNRMALLNQYLEGFKGTVYRQTMFAEFEKEAHAMAERGESLDAESLSDLYEKLIRLYFGPKLVVDEEVRYEWARIPHFYRPFYVYVYATGYSSAVALSEMILHEGAPAVKRYKEFLSMGSSQYPIDELRHAGVDLTTPEPVTKALEKFARILDEAEKLAE